MRPATDFDHLVLGVPNLEAARNWFAERGLSSVIGGRHPRFGTVNALIGLGGRHYLEIVACDEGVPREAEPPFGLANVTQPVLLSWAFETTDIDSLVGTANAAGSQYELPLTMQRELPESNKVLRWKRSHSATTGLDVPVPFILEWGDAKHPSEDAAVEVTGFSLEVVSAEPDAVRLALAAIGVDGSLVRAAEAHEPCGLRLTLNTAAGTVVTV